MQIFTIPVTPFLQNCRIVRCESTNSAVVVDPGGDAQEIIKLIENKKLNIVAIWLTHGHLDHVGAANILRDKYDIQIIGPHKNEHFWFENLPMQAQMFGFNAIKPFFPDHYLSHNDVISVGKLNFTVKHCPGHTPGHVVFYQAQQKCVLVGDVIFKGAVGRTDFPKGNSQQLIASINDHILTLADETVIMSGHGNNSSVGEERKSNPFLSGQFG
jgi:hydroxyacylglutathione hydrolase